MFRIKVPKSKSILNDWIDNLKRGTKEGLFNSRSPILGSIKRFTPVVTGNLQRSITSMMNERFVSNVIRAKFYSDLYYARIIDEGLYGYKRRDYLQKGINQEFSALRTRIEDNISMRFM